MRGLRGRPFVVGLWAAAAVAAAVLMVALLRDEKGPRDDVAAYIGSVNVAAKSSQKNLRTVQRAFRQFELAPAKAEKQAAALRGALRELTRMRARVERVPAPPQARVLRQRLLAFFAQQEAVTRELVGVTTYVPRLAAAERSIAPANARMRAALRGGTSVAAQADALTGYARALDRAAAQVAGIEPPPLFRSMHASQLKRLRRGSTLIRRLTAALRANDRPALERTVRQLGSAESGGTAAARRAVVAYNGRVAKIRKLAAGVERERRKLDEALQ